MQSQDDACTNGMAERAERQHVHNGEACISTTEHVKMPNFYVVVIQADVHVICTQGESISPIPKYHNASLCIWQMNTACPAGAY